MIMEALVTVSCTFGNGESCLAGMNEYVKYNKLDTKAQVIEENVKKKYPSLHFAGMVLGTAVRRKYKFLIYRNIWYDGDYSDINNPKSIVIYKYNF